MYIIVNRSSFILKHARRDFIKLYFSIAWKDFDYSVLNNFQGDSGLFGETITFEYPVFLSCYSLKDFDTSKIDFSNEKIVEEITNKTLKDLFKDDREFFRQAEWVQRQFLQNEYFYKSEMERSRHLIEAFIEGIFDILWKIGYGGFRQDLYNGSVKPIVMKILQGKPMIIKSICDKLQTTIYPTIDNDEIPYISSGRITRSLFIYDCDNLDIVDGRESEKIVERSNKRYRIF